MSCANFSKILYLNATVQPVGQGDGVGGPPTELLYLNKLSGCGIKFSCYFNIVIHSL